MKYKVGDKVRVRIDLVPCEKYGSLTFLDGSMSKCAGQICTIMKVLADKKYYVRENPFAWSEEMLKPAVPTLVEIKEKKLTCVIHTPTQYSAKMVVNTIPVDNKGTIYNSWSDFWNNYKDDTCYKIVDGELYSYQNKKYFKNHNADNGKPYTIYEFSDLFPVDSTISNGFRGGKKSADVDGGLVSIHDVDTHELWTTPFIIPKDRLDALVDAWAKLGCTTFRVSPSETDELIKKEFNVKWIEEEKKMPTKFTFYVKEGTRPDKKCNGLIPTMTTTVVDASGKKATVTCDKADYSERQGVLEAIAQLACGGNFDKEYDKAVKKNKLIELHDRTCTYCGKVFDTVEELKEHEAWHVECKKARRERYLLRKRAKEIAFEEQAQKMAKEMIKEDK